MYDYSQVEAILKQQRHGHAKSVVHSFGNACTNHLWCPVNVTIFVLALLLLPCGVRGANRKLKHV